MPLYILTEFLRLDKGARFTYVNKVQAGRRNAIYRIAVRHLQIEVHYREAATEAFGGKKREDAVGNDVNAGKGKHAAGGDVQ